MIIFAQDALLPPSRIDKTELDIKTATN